MNRNFYLAAAMSAGLFAGCVSTPPSPAGTLKVSYSTTLIDRSRLNEAPTEVQLVQRETTGRNVAAQVGLNVLMMALGGGAGVSTFSKDDLAGDPIEGVVDRSNLANPVSTGFVQSLQEAVSARMAEEGRWRDRSFTHPLVVGGGRATLVYDNLMGSEEPQYQLALRLDVYKRREGNWPVAPRLVLCDGRSQTAQPLAQWAASSYVGVQQELQRMLGACQEKVVAGLPGLLED